MFLKSVHPSFPEDIHGLGGAVAPTMVKVSTPRVPPSATGVSDPIPHLE